jgi:hypothetical protein
MTSEVCQFVVLSIVNLGLMAFIIRKWSIVSAEGLCMAYLGMAVLTDNVALVFDYLVSPATLPLGHQELAFRLHPTIVHIAGLAVLLFSLLVFNPRPKPITRELRASEIQRLRQIGIAITAFGIGLLGVALYLVGAYSAPHFFVALNTFRTEVTPFGGFWYRGADIIVFGLALTLPGLGKKRGRFLMVLALMMFVSFFLRTNKGGLEEPILWAAAVLYVYDRAFFKSLLRLRIVALAAAIMFLGLGVKGWFLPWALQQASSAPPTFQRLAAMAIPVVEERWGDDALYRGYCQFVNTWPDYRYLFQGQKVGIYTLTSWVPRLLYPNKPDHPFRGLGFMIYADAHAYPMETPAPTLMGSVFADDGYASMVGYLFLAGLFLSLFRRLAASRKSSLVLHVGYMIFVVLGGFSAESGIIGLIYTLILAYGVVGFAYFVGLAHSVVQAYLRGPHVLQNAPTRTSNA